MNRIIKTGKDVHSTNCIFCAVEPANCHEADELLLHLCGEDMEPFLIILLMCRSYYIVQGMKF